jgi:hypothetical protein
VTVRIVVKTRIVSICYPYLALLVAAFVLTPFSTIQVNAYTTPLAREALAGVAAPTPCASCWPCRTPPPIREALARADAVFIGKAIKGDEEKEKAISCGARLYGSVGHFGEEYRGAGIGRDSLGLIPVRRVNMGAPGITITARDNRGQITGYEDIIYYIVASSAPKPVEAYLASSMYFYSEPQLVEPKRDNVTGLRLTLSWDKGTLRDFFEKKRDQQK